ncbi:MAG: hypothetical protein QF707_07180, partial [Candidatus Poseidoniaceae archaeon]|nr:hypothetical protein [Candidatus Poseidoniaceae archaeon]
MPLRVHDTLRRQKVDFSTMEPSKVKMYVCGVTVYDLCHLGHARCYISFDLIHRWLEYSGYDVLYVQNFTDIDDKIIARSIESGIDWKDIVEDNIEAARLCHKYNINFYSSFVVGTPYETWDDYVLTRKMIKKIKPHSVGINVFVGLPRSALYLEILNNNSYEYQDTESLLYPPGWDVKCK